MRSDWMRLMDRKHKSRAAASARLSSGRRARALMDALEPRLLFSAAVINTDKSDYQFGNQVTITGTDFAPNETVQLQLPGYTAWQVSTDTSGQLSSTVTINVPETPATVLQLTANGQTGDSAQTQFTYDNSAPVLSLVNPVNSIFEDDVNNSGTLVKDLLSGGFASASDVDLNTQLGIAVSAVDTDHGTWQYSLDNGATWTAFGAPTMSNARLLAGDDNTRVRLVPNANFTGFALIVFRAWDQSTGTAGGTADITAHGGTTAFSDSQAGTSISVLPGPEVNSIARNDPTPNTGGDVHWTITFNASVSGVDATDFALAATGVTGATITNVAMVNPTTYIVTVSRGTGDGRLGLNLVDDDSIVNASTGAPLGGVGVSGPGDGSFTGQVYLLDAPPVVSSITATGLTPTNATSVSWSVVFSKAVTGVDTSDFALAGAGATGATISAVSGSGANWTVTVNSGNDGVLGLNLVDDDSIQDAAGVPLGGTGTHNGDFTGQAYLIDRTAPSVSFDTPATGTYLQNITLTGTASDALSGISALVVQVTRASDGTVLAQGPATMGTGSTWSFVYTAVEAGADQAILIATDAAGNSATSSQMDLTINKATPVIAWDNPSPIVYGTALGTSQLDATASVIGLATVPGAFVYTPTAGTILHAGTGQTLSVTFSPSDTANINSQIATVTIDVQQAPLTIMADNKSKVFGDPDPALTAWYTGFVNGDTPASLAQDVTLAVASYNGFVGTYTITATGAASSDYNITLENGTLTVTPAVFAISGLTNQNAAQGTTANLSLGSISDPGWQNNTFTVNVDWGDSATASFTQTTAGSLGSLANTYPTSGDFVVTVSVSDLHGDQTSGTFTVQVTASAASTVVNRQLFYATSSFAEGGNDGAIATDKTALLPGQTGSFANYSSYTGGIDGIMVDIAGGTGTVTLADFAIKVGNDSDPADWAAGPAPVVNVRPGAGIGGSTRVELTWADGTIANEWMQVTVMANKDTHLGVDDVFYFGNAIGEVGDSAADAKVTAVDELMVRANAATGVGITDPYDFNRDGNVDQTDESIAQSHQTSFFNALQLIAPPGSLNLVVGPITSTGPVPPGLPGGPAIPPPPVVTPPLPSVAPVTTTPTTADPAGPTNSTGLGDLTGVDLPPVITPIIPVRTPAAPPVVPPPAATPPAPVPPKKKGHKPPPPPKVVHLGLSGKLSQIQALLEAFRRSR